MTIPIESLIDRYRPIFFLHRNEEVGPISFSNFLKECQLVDKTQPNRILMQKGEIDELPLNNSNCGLIWKGTQNPPSIPCSVPIYATHGFYKNDMSLRGNNIIFIRYTTFYAYQNGYPAFGCNCKCCKRYGNHILDIESFTVYVNQESGELLKAYLSAHGSKQGKWVSKKDLHYDVRTHRPILYVAKTGHGLYNKPKKYYRLFCVANDDCTKPYIKWDPSIVEILHEDSSIMKFKGEWPNGSYFYPNKILSGDNPPYSANCSDRLFKCWKW